MLELLRRHWPMLAAFLALIALVAWAYLQGVSAGKTDRTAHYEAILAERDRAAAQALADALTRPRPRLPRQWRQSVPTCRPRSRPRPDSKP